MNHARIGRFRQLLDESDQNVVTFREQLAKATTFVLAPGTGARTRHEGGARRLRHRAAAEAVRRRHRPDHPRRVAEAGRAHRFRAGSVRDVARRPRLRAQRRALRRAPRSSSPGRRSVSGRHASTPCGRSSSTGSTPSSRRASRTSSATTAPRTASWRSSCRSPSSSASGRRSTTTRRPRSPSTSSGSSSRSPRSGWTEPFPMDVADPGPIPPRPRRRRHHAHPRRRDQHLRDAPPRRGSRHPEPHSLSSQDRCAIPLGRQNRSGQAWCRAPLRRRRSAAVVVVATGWRQHTNVPLAVLPAASATSNVPDHAALGELDRAGVRRRHLVGAADVERDVVRAGVASRPTRAAPPRRVGCPAPSRRRSTTDTVSSSPAVERRARGVEADRVERVGAAPSPGRG